MAGTPLIVAHRGASFDAPENTLAALGLGFAQGADAGECDIRLTRDGRAVLLHDASTRRTTGVEWTVAAQSFDALRGLDAGRWKSEQWAGEKIPALAEALAVLPAARRLLVEIKCGVEIFPEIERAFADAGAERRVEAVILMSFDRVVTAEAKRRFPTVEVHQITEWREDLTAAGLVAEARAAGLDGLNLDRRFPIDAAFVATVHGAGLKLYVWTVDDASLARRLVAAGVDGITTNRPGWLRANLG